ncbi:hypothetical protein LCGC14_1159260 [marine sediment metagenome]|uniref:HK97 gp10 family phage protein n=1 Tax=marine sediment metagenome TaxID=412755 RepID=A0A0F9PYV3_9ZZZZ
MIGLQTKLTATPKRVDTAVKKGAFNSFSHAAASIRKSARDSIVESDKPGPPGGPIHSKPGPRGGAGLAKQKRSLLFHADKDGAVIGFMASTLDQSMETHEHGLTRGGVKFPKRPTMQPALERSLARFHREWEGAIR